MDFYRIGERVPKQGQIQVFPDFKVTKSKDLMIRGRKFYAVWNAQTGLWSQDEYDVAELVDQDLLEHCDRLIASGGSCPDRH